MIDPGNLLNAVLLAATSSQPRLEAFHGSHPLKFFMLLCRSKMLIDHPKSFITPDGLFLHTYKMENAAAISQVLIRFHGNLLE
jgi:hypothetical protein